MAALLLAPAALADTLRIATWHADLSRATPGTTLQRLLAANDPDVAAKVAVIVAVDADIIVLTDIDWDLGLVTLGALADRLAAAGAPYPHRLALQPNRGLRMGLDLDGDGTTTGPDDAQGWGPWTGFGGMAILSRLPIDRDAVQDLSALLWRDLPGAIVPPMPAAQADVQRLSTTGHWIVPVTLPDGGRLTLLPFAATAPVFDGPDDRNGRRNHDEAALWLRLLDGALPLPPPAPPFVVLGHANLDPVDGEGRPAALRALLSDPRLQDPAPRGSHGRSEPAHKGNPALDTALFTDPPLGGLRLGYVLPSAGLVVQASGVLWPPDTTPLAGLLAAASRHRPVWVDIALPLPTAAPPPTPGQP